MSESKMKKKLMLKVNGMSCSSCELRLKEAFEKVEWIYKAKANKDRQIIILEIKDGKFDENFVKTIIEELGYRYEGILQENNKLRVGSIFILVLAFGLIGVAFILQSITGFNFLPVITPEMGYGILFIVGLLSSIHCIGMCGGINLSQTIKGCAENGKNFIPSLKYNTGRLVSYTLIGGMIGGIGKVFAFSSLTKGFIFIFAGIFMLIMGMNLLGVFSIGGFISKIFGGFYNKINIKGKVANSFVIGLLNGFMPCGPLQGMQFYALTTGGFLAGALSMFFFALGTFPLMFLFGSLATLLSRRFAKNIMKVSGFILIFLSLSMVSNGLSLTGNPLIKRSTKNFSVAKIDKDIQTIVTEIESNKYPPIVVQKGIPVKWKIIAKPENLNSCNNAIVIPAYNINKRLVPGENIIEFTPTNEGNIYYSCWMGMISSTIKVVNDINQSGVITENDIPELGKGGTSCCNVGKSSQYAAGSIPLDRIGVAEVKDGYQEVVIDVDDNGYNPSVIVLQKGIQAKIKFNPLKLTSCNYVVVFPEYRGKLDLSVGQWETPLLNISTDFTFTCWMGMLNGYVRVVDDLRKVNVEEIKKEFKNYRSQSSGSCCGG